MGFTERLDVFLVYISNYYYFIPYGFLIITEHTAVTQQGKIVSDEHSFWREKVKLFWIIKNIRVIKNMFSKELLSLLFYFQSLILFHHEYVAFIEWLPLCYVKPRNSHWIKTERPRQIKDSQLSLKSRYCPSCNSIILTLIQFMLSISEFHLCVLGGSWNHRELDTDIR